MAVAAVLAGGLSSAAGAAGLGRLTVQSGLGQPLNAEVEVTSLSREELSSLSARLAAPDAYRRVGLEMTPALGSLRFAIEERPSGNPVVRITSEQPINEPFVDMLVELNWAAGRFVREYTFLLDPPELQFGRESVEGRTVMSQLATPVVATAAPAVPVSQRAARAHAGSAGAAGTPARTARAAPGNAAGAAGTSRPFLAQAAGAPAAAQPSGFAAGQATPGEVTVQRGDTLAAIAERVKPADIAVEQAIISIYEANPRAFFGSVHQLRAGRSLSIPDRAAMEAVDTREARRQIRMQAADFNAYRERLASATRKVDVAETGASASGAITARVDESGAAPVGGDQLRLSRSAPGEGSDAAGSATGTQGGQVNAEALIASQAALREQTERVSLLEKNIADLQRLLELKNQQLAQMQLQAELQSEATQAGVATANAAAGAVGTAASGSQPASEAAAASGAVASAAGFADAGTNASASGGTDAAREAGMAGMADAAGRAAGTDTVLADGAIEIGETAAADGPAGGAATDAQAAAASDTASGTASSSAIAAASEMNAAASEPGGAGADASASDAPALVAASSAAPATAAPVAGTQADAAPPSSPVPAPAPAVQPGMVDQLLASPYTMPGLAAVLVALGGYGWYTMRRRRKAEAFEDSLLAADAFTANSLFGTTGGQAVDTNSPSMFGPSVGDTASDPHSTEVDPIAEAEVYIAYGRESQAEEILREALKRQPERQAIRLKLLEICAGRKDAEAFGMLAREMYEQAGGANEEWPQVLTLGLALDPDNPLYSGTLDAAADVDAPPAVSGVEESARETGDREGMIEQAFGQPAFERSDLGDDDRASPRQAAFEGSEDLAIGVPPPVQPRVETPSRVDAFAETQAMGDKPGAGQPGAEEEPLLDFSLDVDTALGRAADAQPATVETRPRAADEPSELERAIGDRFELPSLDFADFGQPGGGRQAEEALSFEPTADGFGPTGDGLESADDEFALAEAGADAHEARAMPSFGEPGKLRIELPSLDELNLQADGEIAAIADEIGALDLSGLDGLPTTDGGSPAWQEMATKLDLASAYEEIGDRDGARELLEEVVRGGDGDQKRQAQAMLASIG